MSPKPCLTSCPNRKSPVRARLAEGRLGGSGSCSRGRLGERPCPSLLFLGCSHWSVVRLRSLPPSAAAPSGQGPSSSHAPVQAASVTKPGSPPSSVGCCLRGLWGPGSCSGRCRVGNRPFFVTEMEAGPLLPVNPSLGTCFASGTFRLARFSLYSHFSRISSSLSVCIREDPLWLSPRTARVGLGSRCPLCPGLLARLRGRPMSDGESSRLGALTA